MESMLCVFLLGQNETWQAKVIVGDSSKEENYQKEVVLKWSDLPCEVVSFPVLVVCKKKLTTMNEEFLDQCISNYDKVGIA